MDLLSAFPEGFTPQPQQEYLLNEIEKAFKKGKKFVICCAPTGSGKSFLPHTLSNVSRSAPAEFVDYIKTNSAYEQDQYGDFTSIEECEKTETFGVFALTVSKSLQDQYKGLFDNSKVLKGKSNYTCDVDPHYEVEVAPCVYLSSLKEKCFEACRCPYYNARTEMLTNKFSVLNYSMFLSLPGHVKRREYIICDEASELEDELVKRYSRSLHFLVLKKLGISISTIPVDNYTQFYTWLNNLILKLLDEVKEYQSKLKKKKDITMPERQRYSLLKNMTMSLQTTVQTWDDCEYLIEKTEDSITLKPLKINNLAQSIFNYGDRVLLMSATIIDHKNFAKTLGITDYEYIEIDSTFDPKNAPIYASSKLKLNYKNIKESLPLLTKQVIEICKHHKDVKGIIHTHTMEITNYLRDHIHDPRFLFRKEGMTNEQIIQQHIESPDSTILVSPSLAFGVDLKDDLARFQIIMKAAYMPLGDERIKRLFKEDPDWYQNKMLNHVIQACGRGIRSKNDTCVTYILDKCITDAVLRNKAKLPRYFLKRFN